VEHEFKVDSPIVIDRILSRNLEKCSEQLRNEIIPDTTPVLFFGDFENATIASVGINPSRYEFPAIKRRLCHLSDLALPEDYYRNGLTGMTEDQATKISKSLVQYFESSNNGEPTYLKKWFDLAESAINGADATYFKNKLKKQKYQIACHVDLFPWATKAYSGLDSAIQKELIMENSEFLEAFITQAKLKQIIIFGKDSLLGLKMAFSHSGSHLAYNKTNSKPGPFGTTFEAGYLELASHKKQFFYTKSGPSRRTTSSFTQSDKEKLHAAFAEYILDRNIRDEASRKIEK
jgi:hypothetical protein